MLNNKKKILQDVMPPRRRSIRDIPLNNKKKSSSSSANSKKVSNKIDNLFESEAVSVVEKGGYSREKRGGAKWWILTLTIVFVSFFVFSVFFSGAQVTIFPKQEKVDFDINGTATEDGGVGVPYKVLTVEEEGSGVTDVYEEKEVTKKASGEIVIFNEYDDSPQRLVINTRFETPDGKIYRTPKSVIVPGRTVNEEGKISPGSVKITVNADSPGDEYNIGLTDFTIPGFKGTDRFGKFYARSKTPMTGGFTGMMRVVEEDQLDAIKKKIHSDLDSKLKELVYSQIPTDSVLYSGGIYIDYERGENTNLDDSVKITERGILKAVIFDKKIISNYIAKNIKSDFTEGEFEILNIEDLNFEIVDKEYVDIANGDGFDFNISGNAHLVADFDSQQISNELAGKPRKTFENFISKYRGIEDVEVSISPFWKRSFPKNAKKIEIIRDLGQ